MRHTRVFGLTAIAASAVLLISSCRFVEIELVRDRERLACRTAQGIDAEIARQG